jgi:hypothetical protein
MCNRDAASEQRADLDLVDVAGDDQRRIVEQGGIVARLGDRSSQRVIGVLALVLPDEAVLTPDVGVPSAAGLAALRHGLLEGEPFAFGVFVDRLANIEQFAKVVEMRLRC